MTITDTPSEAVEAIEKQALALINEVLREHGSPPYTCIARSAIPSHEIACRAIERHEAFKQEVSEAIERWDNAGSGLSYEEGLALRESLTRFIIPKPDPLVEALADMKDGRAGATTESYAACLRACLAARGLKIVEADA